MGGTVYAQQTPASDQDYLKRVATAAAEHTRRRTAARTLRTSIEMLCEKM